jgi:hypothetical protein
VPSDWDSATGDSLSIKNSHIISHLMNGLNNSQSDTLCPSRANVVATAKVKKQATFRKLVDISVDACYQRETVWFRFIPTKCKLLRNAFSDIADMKSVNLLTSMRIGTWERRGSLPAGCLNRLFAVTSLVSSRHLSLISILLICSSKNFERLVAIIPDVHVAIEGCYFLGTLIS